MVRRHTRSPVTRRSTRATQAQAAPDRPARHQRSHSKRVTRPVSGPRSSLGSHGRDSRRARSVTIRHDLSCHVTIWSFWVAISAPRAHPPTKKRPRGVVHDPNPTRIKETLRGKFCWGEIQSDDVGGGAGKLRGNEARVRRKFSFFAMDLVAETSLLLLRNQCVGARGRHAERRGGRRAERRRRRAETARTAGGDGARRDSTRRQRSETLRRRRAER